MFRMQIEGGLFGNVCSQPRCHRFCMDPTGLRVMAESSSGAAVLCSLWGEGLIYS